MVEVNANKRWVRILRQTRNGFVEFEFFVSDQDLFVELILPVLAFRDFCISNRVELLDQEITTSESSETAPGGLLKRIK
jgi:phenol hydroxylase P0 protein